MRLGVLYKPVPGHHFAMSVKLAVTNFNNAPHCGRRGHKPAEIRLHPAELPADLHHEGLAIHPDDRVRPGYIRVTTCDLLPDYVTQPDPNGDDLRAEYYRSKQQFNQQVEAAL